MKSLTLLASAVFAFAALASARPLTVGAPDGSGNVSITIGGTGTQNQTLIAAWANGDKGNDPLDWTEYADAGTVAPSDTSKTFQIPAAWRAKSGAVRFFLMSGEKPYGKRLDYITRPNTNANGIALVDGGLYIDTTIVPNPTVDISVKFQSPNFKYGSMVPFGIHKAVTMFSAGQENNNYHFYFFGAGNPRHPSLGMQLGIADTDVFGNTLPKDASPHTFRMSSDGIWIDGYRRVGAFNSAHFTNTTTQTIALFARRDAWKQANTVCTIYSAVIYTNGVLAADLVPVAAPSGYVQMWDRVARTYRGRSGTQKDDFAFWAGNDIGPYPPDCGSVETVSSVINIGTSISVGSPNFSENTIAVTLSSGHDAGILLAVAGTNSESAAFSEWTTNAVVQKVAADVNEVSVSLPRKWIRENYNIRFAWKSIAGLPYDYEVKSLSSDSTGKQRIRTGWVPSTNTTIHVNAKTAYNTCAFGIVGAYYLVLNGYGSGSQIYYSFFKKSDGTNLSGTIGEYRSDEFAASYHDWRLGPGEARVDNESVALTGYVPNETVTTDMLLPFRAASTNDSSYVSDVSKLGDVSVRFAKIWEGDEIVRDYVPSVKDGLPGFYDRVRKTFVRSVTATPFVAGAPVVADGDILSWSEVRSLRKGLAIIFR